MREEEPERDLNTGSVYKLALGRREWKKREDDIKGTKGYLGDIHREIPGSGARCVRNLTS